MSLGCLHHGGFFPGPGSPITPFQIYGLHINLWFAAPKSHAYAITAERLKKLIYNTFHRDILTLIVVNSPTEICSKVPDRQLSVSWQSWNISQHSRSGRTRVSRGKGMFPFNSSTPVNPYPLDPDLLAKCL